MADKLKIKIDNSPGIHATFQELVAREILGINVLGTIDVNGDQTEATWSPFFTPSYRLTAIGDSLAASGITLTGGAIASFSLEDTALAALTGVMSNFNQSATTVQANIDDANAMRSANGWTFDQEVAYFNTITFALHALNFFGGTGNDLIEGGQQADVLRGNGGDDTVLASPGDDTIHAGAGNDMIDFSGLSKFGGLTGDLAAHTVTIGAAAITGGGASAQANAPGAGIEQAIFGFESFILTDNGDAYSGDFLDNTIDGGAGADSLNGKGGNDLILGHAGPDDLYGNGGDDVIFGGDGLDVIHGNAGNDELFGEADADIIYGDADNDFISGLGGRDQLRGGAGKDTIDGGTGQDFILGGADDDVLNGEEDWDTIKGQDGNDSIMGGGGRDTLDGGIGRDTILGGGGVDDLHGGSGVDSDTLLGGAKGDFIYGEYGDDLLKGQGGRDYIIGGPDDDRLLGGAGNDYLFGDEGNDHLTGGPNADTFYFDLKSPQGSDVITDFAALDKIKIDGVQLASVSIMTSGSDAIIDYGLGVITANETSMLIAVQDGPDALITLLV